MNQLANVKTDRRHPSEEETKRLPRRWMILILLASAAPLSFLYLTQTNSLAATGYDVAVLQDEKKVWQMRNEQLRLEVSQLESLDRIDRLAASKLGMGPPQRQVFVNASALTFPPPEVAPPPSTPARVSRLAWIIQQLIGNR